MRNRHLLNDQGGFTLIEIIAVLVILGILAAVAVPKFFDLQIKAREKVIYAAMSEVEARVNQYFAKKLLEGYTWKDIWTSAESDIGTNLGSDFTNIVYTLSGDPPDKQTGTLNVKGNYLFGDSAGNSIPINKDIDLPRYQ